MFARLTKFQVKIDRIDEGAKLYKESAVPAAKSQQGFRGIYFLIDRNTGSGVSLSFCSHSAREHGIEVGDWEHGSALFWASDVEGLEADAPASPST